MDISHFYVVNFWLKIVKFIAFLDFLANYMKSFLNETDIKLLEMNTIGHLSENFIKWG